MRIFVIVVLYLLGFCVFCTYTEKCKEKAKGTFHLICDGDETYSPVQCNKTHCFCVGKNGIRIENYYAPIESSKDMDCKCARDKKEYQDKMLIGRMFHCTPNGSYRSIQCLGSVCYCVDRNGKAKPRNFVPVEKIAALHCSENV